MKDVRAPNLGSDVILDPLDVLLSGWLLSSKALCVLS